MATLISLPSVGYVECDFKSVRPRDTNRMEGRRTEAQTFGTPYWTASYRAGALTKVQEGLVRGFMMQAGDDGEVFAAYDAWRPRPIAYAEGNYFPGVNFGNLMSNGGFETGASSPWAFSAGVTINSSIGHTGSYCMQLDKGTSGIGNGTQRAANQLVTNNIIAGKQYRLGAWVMGNVNSLAGAYLSIEWRTAANAIISTSPIVTNAGFTTAWQFLSGTAVAPANAARAVVYATLATTGAAQIMFMDDFTFGRYESFVGSGVLQAITNAFTIVVNGLPDGFKLSVGDYVEIRKSLTVRSLHLITEDAIANSSGVVTLKIKYALDLQTFTLPCTVHFEKASCLMQIDPGSYAGPKSWASREPSFAATEVFFS
ncbi:putative carbohydrate binding protein [Phyllobacterium sp. YR531]|nr:carbohydrate binding domain-containing protein [Phyllobacterium sp. YR531]EJN04228.1 putative carbohydrate binding protein [Phyllobacterium sp. YR531]